MQEKTLEEEFKTRFKVKIETHPSGTFAGYCLWDNIKNDFATQEELISFISSREEKAREEGRKEGYKEYHSIYADSPKDKMRKIHEAIITQYKEELLKSLPKENSIFEIDKLIQNDNKYVAGKLVGFNECLSEVKKLLS